MFDDFNYLYEIVCKKELNTLLKTIVKMKKAFFIVLCMLLFNRPIYAQFTDINSTYTTEIRGFDIKSSSEVIGSSYLHEDFKPVKLADDKKVYFLRYNAYNDEMEMQKSDKIYALKKIHDFPIVFSSLNKIYLLFNYKNETDTVKGYFVVLYDGGKKASLLLKEKIIYIEEVVQKTGYGSNEPPTLKRIKDKMYITFGDNSAKELPKKKKEILNLFGGKSKDIETFSKENKIGFKSKEDLSKIIEHYNLLVK